MKRIAMAALALVAVLAPGAPVTAQDRVAEPGFVGEKVSLDLRDVALVDVLSFFHRQFGLNFVVDRTVPPIRVTVMLEDVPWNVALEQILKANGLGAIREGEDTLVVARPN